MASLSSVNINVSKIPKDKLYEGQNGKYLQLTFVQNNELDQYGNNVAVYVSQSKEERDQKKNKIYLGNGKVVWGDDISAKVAPKDKPKDKGLSF